MHSKDIFGSGSPLTPPPNVERVKPVVLLTPLSAAEKKSYALLPESLNESQLCTSNLRIDEIVGELQGKDGEFYFARYQGGISYKYWAPSMKAHFPGLVKEYENKKKAGELEPFDPTGQSVHPLSRVKMYLNISKNRDSVKISSASTTRSERYWSSDESQETEENESDGDYSSDKPRRMSTRQGLRSGEKTRKRRRRRSLEEEDEAEDSRYSSTSGSNESLFGQEDSSMEEEADFRPINPKAKANRERKRKVVRPAYGRIRPIGDMLFEEEDDVDASPLMRHWSSCEKCHRSHAQKLLALEKRRPKGRKKARDDLEFENEAEAIYSFGGWVRCLKCPSAIHWRCLSSAQRGEILKATREIDRAEWLAKKGDSDEEPKTRPGLGIDESTDYICNSCLKGGICMGCMEVALEPDSSILPKTSSRLNASESSSKALSPNDNTKTIDGSQPEPSNAEEDVLGDRPAELLFRCRTCKRLAHYAHLKPPNDVELLAVGLADHYQFVMHWECADCHSFKYPLDKIIAWRPYPANAIEPNEGVEAGYRKPMPREYLVKWVDRGYNRAQWVPHMFLVSRSNAKLRNFFMDGTKVKLLEEPVDPDQANNTAPETSEATFEIGDEDSRDSTKPDNTDHRQDRLRALPDAERMIPLPWKTADRVLDILIWLPPRRKKSTKGKTRTVESSADEADEEVQAIREAAYDLGEKPGSQYVMSVFEWESRTRKSFGVEHAELVAWAYIKWDELSYDEATWDSPPRQTERGYPAFKSAIERYAAARQVDISNTRKADDLGVDFDFDNRPKDEYRKKYALKAGAQPKNGQSSDLKLMTFQIDGFNWLCNNWWNLQHCILADEMGLGKTVQIASFVGYIVQEWRAAPVLVIVPNSTITNWEREFRRWAPHLRVVPFYGESKAREIIKKYELYHDNKVKGRLQAKFHVLITTYEAIINQKDFTSVFKNQGRWECLITDEGQRLKNDGSLLFKKLNELNSIHRIIMTGTPLNNNIRELFNLMNHLDPDEWNDLEEMEKEHEELTEDLIKQLHVRLRPYFLRRIKSEVLQLPPKNEVIVPVSMAPLQKEIYKSILSRNADILKGLSGGFTTKANAVSTQKSMNNMLMELRKCLQHPYLHSVDIEPKGLSEREAHEKLIDGSAKLRFLKILLPKLKARGHRVLLFSQFVIALDFIEDFMRGEGFKFLRLDGNTKQADRQKGMDEFNRPGSDYFIYLLTTRAGGVGINLWSADTVIIFDPDYNPHQDLQAISRAHRYGQKKTCLVFKLMVKDSAEERIVQTGKKKLALDHLIVQKMDDDTGRDVQSILTYGARALFEADGGASRDVHYSDLDIDKLIEKTETEADAPASASDQTKQSFTFAKIWSADKDTLEEVDDHEQEDQSDSWAKTLQRIAEEREKMKPVNEATGRGVRRAAAVAADRQQQQQLLQANASFGGSPSKHKGKQKAIYKSKATISDGQSSRGGSSYKGSDKGSSSELSDIDNRDFPMLDSVVQDAMADKGNGLQDKNPKQPGAAVANGTPIGSGQASGSGIVETTGAQKPWLKSKALKNRREFSSTPADNSSAAPAAGNQPRNTNGGPEVCSLCKKVHAAGECEADLNSEQLAEYRYTLLVHAGDETLQDRKQAIAEIDAVLKERGKLNLIVGQPLFLLEKRGAAANAPVRRPAVPNQQPSTIPIQQTPVVGPHKQPIQHGVRPAQQLMPVPQQPIPSQLQARQPVPVQQQTRQPIPMTQLPTTAVMRSRPLQANQPTVATYQELSQPQQIVLSAQLGPISQRPAPTATSSAQNPPQVLAVPAQQRQEQQRQQPARSNVPVISPPRLLNRALVEAPRPSTSTSTTWNPPSGQQQKPMKAGPSKRPAPSTGDSPMVPKKKKKTSGGTTCVLCKGVGHTTRECPELTEGSELSIRVPNEGSSMAPPANTNRPTSRKSGEKKPILVEEGLINISSDSE